MDAGQRKRWVAALNALRTAGAASGMAGGQMRRWALDALAAMPSADLDAGSRDAIVDACLVAIQPEASLLPAAARLPAVMRSEKLEAREWDAEPQRIRESACGRAPDTVSVLLTPLGPGAAPRLLRAANISMATGIGAEREIAGYQPPPFWSVSHRAPWSTPPASSSTGKKNIVIAAAGDGAIQDTLKSLFSKPVNHLIP